jgi:hypothetical protein
LQLSAKGVSLNDEILIRQILFRNGEANLEWAAAVWAFVTALA